jgi:hypothetical protein
MFDHIFHLFHYTIFLNCSSLDSFVLLFTRFCFFFFSFYFYLEDLSASFLLFTLEIKLAIFE